MFTLVLAAWGASSPQPKRPEFPNHLACLRPQAHELEAVATIEVPRDPE